MWAREGVREGGKREGEGEGEGEGGRTQEPNMNAEINRR